MSENEFALHADPVWRDRANFIINARLPKNSTDKRFEQLWTRQITDDEFELCCIPFFLYDVALGDIVRASPEGDRPYLMADVLRPSGHFAFRIWFGDSQGSPSGVVDELNRLGCLMEWSSTNLLAVDAKDAGHAQIVADHLWAKEQNGELTYETARSA